MDYELDQDLDLTDPTDVVAAFQDDESTGSMYGRPLDNIPLHHIVIRDWELTSNSTHYDKLVAAPSDEELIDFWIGWSTIMFFTAILTTVILIPLCLSPKIRRNPFHYYLVFLMIPDCLVAWICGITCLTNAMAGYFTSEFLCYFQSFYMMAYIAANGWLNACVARQLFQMLYAAKNFQRYDPPSKGYVLKQVAVVYIYASGLGAMGLLNSVDWWPYKTRLSIGGACLPMDYDTISTVFFYCVMFPLLFGAPLLYVLWVSYQIYKHQLLPPSGRRRVLAIYFIRLVAVFLLMWLPGLLLLFVTGAWVDPWLAWAGGSWSHLQGTVSALVSLMKPDIWETVRAFWTCNYYPVSEPKRNLPQHQNRQTVLGSGASPAGNQSLLSSWYNGKSSFQMSGTFNSRWSNQAPRSKFNLSSNSIDMQSGEPRFSRSSLGASNQFQLHDVEEEEEGECEMQPFGFVCAVESEQREMTISEINAVYNNEDEEQAVEAEEEKVPQQQTLPTVATAVMLDQECTDDNKASFLHQDLPRTTDTTIITNSVGEWDSLQNDDGNEHEFGSAEQ